MRADLRHAAGSLLVVGVAGPELSGLERAWLKLVRPSGVILFRRNISDARQTRALLKDAIALCAPYSLRCVDVEGGTVDRLRDALAPIPSAQAVAHAAGGERRKQGLAREQGELIARSVKAFGFNTTLAPVLDLALLESAKVLGTRAVSSAWREVAEYALGFLGALREQGVVGCGKHFPGLGAAALDSHLETPSIRRSFHELWEEDMAPYRDLRGQLPMVMVNHAKYPNTLSGSEPASVSRFWIATVLRKKIGYRGIIFSDDMEMGGVLSFLSIEEAAIAAIRAGTDLMEICHSPELILRAYEALVTEGEKSAAFRTLLLDRASQTTRKRARLFPEMAPAPPSRQQLENLRNKILRFRERIGEHASVSAAETTLVESA
jgi:beta-N-acetylhexosaminidase